MVYLRKLYNSNATNGKKHLSVSIPVEAHSIFVNTERAIVEVLPDRRGIVVRPAKVETL